MRFSLCPAGRAGAGLRQDPSLAKGVRASEPRASASGSPGSAPTATSSSPRPVLPPPPPLVSQRLSPLGEWALSRGAQTWRPTQRRARRAGPAWRTRSRREAGRGGGEDREGAVSGWAPSRSRLHRCITPALPSSATAHTAPPPRPGAHPLPPRGSLRGTTISQVEAQPRPTPALLGGPPTQTLPGFFPVSIPRDGRSSLFPMCPSALSAAPRPQLLTPVWAMSCTTLWPRPGTWRVGGRRGPGRRAERCAGQGMRPGDRGDAESLQCVSESERTAPGEQVPVARRAHQRASKQRP